MAQNEEYCLCISNADAEAKEKIAYNWLTLYKRRIDFAHSYYPDVSAEFHGPESTDYGFDVTAAFTSSAPSEEECKANYRGFQQDTYPFRL